MQKFKKIVIFDIDYTLFNTAFFKESNLTNYVLYAETENVLQQLSTIATLGILSEGEYDFQQKKLHKTNIDRYFDSDHIHIVTDKLALLQTLLAEKKSFESIYFVDDKLPVLHAAKNYLPGLITIWIKRGEYADKQKAIKGFTADVQVTNLQEIVSVISQK